MHTKYTIINQYICSEIKTKIKDLIFIFVSYILNLEVDKHSNQFTILKILMSYL